MSISSIARNITMMLRRTITPATPMAKMIALSDSHVGERGHDALFSVLLTTTAVTRGPRSSLARPTLRASAMAPTIAASKQDRA